MLTIIGVLDVEAKATEHCLPSASNVLIWSLLVLKRGCTTKSIPSVRNFITIVTELHNTHHSKWVFELSLNNRASYKSHMPRLIGLGATVTRTGRLSSTYEPESRAPASSTARQMEMSTPHGSVQTPCEINTLVSSRTFWVPSSSGKYWFLWSSQHKSPYYKYKKIQKSLFPYKLLNAYFPFTLCWTVRFALFKIKPYLS